MQVTLFAQLVLLGDMVLTLDLLRAAALELSPVLQASMLYPVPRHLIWNSQLCVQVARKVLFPLQEAYLQLNVLNALWAHTQRIK